MIKSPNQFDLGFLSLYNEESSTRKGKEKMTHREIAQQILAAVGGPNNIQTMSHCMTPVSYTHLTLPTN